LKKHATAPREKSHDLPDREKINDKIENEFMYAIQAINSSIEAPGKAKRQKIKERQQE
jgi:hypothetical protein